MSRKRCGTFEAKEQHGFLGSVPVQVQGCYLVHISHGFRLFLKQCRTCASGDLFWFGRFIFSKNTELAKAINQMCQRLINHNAAFLSVFFEKINKNMRHMLYKSKSHEVLSNTLKCATFQKCDKNKNSRKRNKKKNPNYFLLGESKFLNFLKLDFYIFTLLLHDCTIHYNYNTNQNNRFWFLLPKKPPTCVQNYLS